jgi:superfamily II DNA or RNA helicase
VFNHEPSTGADPIFLESIMKLRPYQATALKNTISSLKQNPILVLPTGGGKTFTAACLVRRLDVPTLWLAHRKELVNQAARQLQKLGLRTQIIMPGYPSYSDFFGFTAGPIVYVASVNTLSRRQMPAVDLVVSDECHHDAARNRKSILDRYSDIPHLGLTATPFRLDGRGLGECGYKEIIVGAWPDELVDDGTLHAPRVYAGQSPDLRGVGKVGADYNLGKLAQKLNTPTQIQNILANWCLRAKGRRTVCFAVDIEHSQAIVRAFLRSGIPAEHLDGSSKDRDAIMARLISGETQVVSNCMVWTEGTDIPSLECAIIARSTASLNLHLQMTGRIMRSCEGKGGAIVLDHAGNHDVHGLVTRRLTYSLDGKVIGEKDPLGLRRCGKCFLLYKPSLQACPECGWAPPQRKIRDYAGSIAGANGSSQDFDELIEFVEDFDYRLQFWHNLEAQREAYGFKPGWSAYRYKERFGVWPETAGGDLINKDAPTINQKREVYQKFLSEGRAKGYKPGYASARYKDMFGEWPSMIIKTAPVQRPVIPPVPTRRSIMEDQR